MLNLPLPMEETRQAEGIPTWAAVHPLGSGLFVLLALGAMYGSKKVLNLNKKENE